LHRKQFRLLNDSAIRIIVQVARLASHAGTGATLCRPLVNRGKNMIDERLVL
jgi:hypothetical protein